MLRTKELLYGLTLMFLTYGAENSATFTPCKDWIPYGDQKCIKIVDRAGTQTKEDAEIVCQSYGDGEEEIPKLVVVKTKEKQEFLQKLFFIDNVIVDNVWLGLDLKPDHTYQWNDDTQLFFTNWAKQNITNDQHQCVQMASGEGVFASGEWVRANCKKRNVVVCEKTQPWSVSKLQNMLVSLQLQLERQSKESNEKIIALQLKSDREISSLKQQTQQELSGVQKQANGQITELQTKSSALEQKYLASEAELTKLKQNPVPKGFIYAQLPGSEPPTVLWPQTTWSEVSTAYAGQFFRVAGGKAAPFGQVQQEGSPRLANVQYNFGKHMEFRSKGSQATVPRDGSWSTYVYSGSDADGNDIVLKWKLSNEEVRPLNQAIRIWKRVK